MLQAMWYGGDVLDQPALVQLRLTEPEVKRDWVNASDVLISGLVRLVILILGWMRTLESPVLFLKGEKKAGQARWTVSPTFAPGQQTTASQSGRQPLKGQKREVLD